MKKNKMMRVASALLVAVLLSTCAISGTFAKYVTTASGSNTARVAKWGVQMSGITNSLFANAYVKDDSTESGTITNTVSATEEVVAPGTKNETGVQFSLTGTPEVAVKVEIVVKGSSEDAIKDVVLPAGTGYKDWTTANTATFDLAAGYHPVVFTLKDGTTTLKTGTLADIESFLEGKSDDYAAGTDLRTILGGTSGVYTLTWEWAFGGNDKADTLLGNLASGTATSITGASTTIDFAIEITATQID